MFYQVNQPIKCYSAYPDSVDSLLFKHTDVKATHTGQFNWRTKRQQALTGNNTASVAKMDKVVPQHVPGERSKIDEATPANLAGQSTEMDEAAPSEEAAQSLQVDEAEAKYRKTTGIEFLACRISSLVLRDQILKEELSQKKTDESIS